MGIRHYLAMTTAEIAVFSLPERIGWLAEPELRLPNALPPGSLLILTDQQPAARWNIGNITAAAEEIRCSALLLDFQRPGLPEQRRFAEELIASLPCPVVVSDAYAAGLCCPVFLSPCPHHMPLTEHLRPWAGREVWLDLAPDGETLTLTRKGCLRSPLPRNARPHDGFREERLHCHYVIRQEEESVVFTLWRSREDLEELAQEANSLGIKNLVGLYQELGLPPEEVASGTGYA